MRTGATRSHAQALLQRRAWRAWRGPEWSSRTCGAAGGVESGAYAELGIGAAIPTTGLCRSLRNPTLGLIDQGAQTRHSLAPSSIGRRAGMMQVCHRLWTLAREPEGPLVRYLDPFAESLDAEGFKRLLIGRQIRIAADFSLWLQSQAIPVEAVSDDQVRQFLGSLTHRLVVRQGGAAALWRLVDFLRRRGICSAPRDPGKATAIQRIVAEYANHLRDDQGLTTGTLTN